MNLMLLFTSLFFASPPEVDNGRNCKYYEQALEMAINPKSFEYLKDEYRDSCDILVSKELIPLFPFSLSTKAQKKYGKKLGAAPTDSALQMSIFEDPAADSVINIECGFTEIIEIGCTNHYLEAYFSTTHFGYF